MIYKRLSGNGIAGMQPFTGGLFKFSICHEKKTAAVSPAPPAYEKILIKGRMPGGRLLNPRHVL
jgi:hypothetical protein